MHAVFFGFKRAHLRVLHITRVMLRPIALTPARFDMMRIVELHREWGVAQAKIQHLLGVTAATVSRMLKSLRLLGFVSRERSERDARCVLVRITDLGLRTVREARERLVDSGVADRMIERGLAFDPDAARPQVDMLQRFLSRIRKNYGDPSPFRHPWWIGDLVPYVFHTVVDGRLHYPDAACRTTAPTKRSSADADC